MRHGLLPSASPLAQQLPRLLSAMEGVVPGRQRPIRQNRKCLVAWATTAPSSPNLPAPLVVRVFEALSVPNDGPLTAKRATPRKQF
jgi:hypothetical protein